MEMMGDHDPSQRGGKQDPAQSEPTSQQPQHGVLHSAYIRCVAGEGGNGIAGYAESAVEEED